MSNSSRNKKTPALAGAEVWGNESNYQERNVMTNNSIEKLNACPVFKDHVYVIEFGLNLVKIGRSINPERRAANLATGSGRKKTRLWVSTPVHGAGPWEARAHAALGNCRQIGEWFECSFDEAVKAVTQEEVAEELWTIEGQLKLNKKSAESFEMLKELVSLSAKDRLGRTHADIKIRFLDDMRERAIKNCEAYLLYRSAAEQCFWDVVERESPDSGEGCLETAIALAYSSEEYLAASRMEHVHLGITMESCMLVLNDIEKIPAMLDEVEAIAHQRAAQQEASL